MQILKPLIVTAIVGSSSLSHAAGTCYPTLMLESDKAFALITNNSLAGDRPVAGDCLDLFIANTSGVSVFDSKVPLVLQLKLNSAEIADAIRRLVALTVDVKIEVTTRAGSGTLKAFSRP